MCLAMPVAVPFPTLYINEGSLHEFSRYFCVCVHNIETISVNALILQSLYRWYVYTVIGHLQIPLSTGRVLHSHSRARQRWQERTFWRLSIRILRKHYL